MPPQFDSTPTVERLIQIWESRYIPNFSSVKNTPEFQQRLVKAISLEGRHKTASKLTERVIALKCQMASLKAKSLYSRLPGMLEFSDTQRLSEFVFIIYLKLAEIYPHPSDLSEPTSRQMPIQAATLLANRLISAAAETPRSPQDWGMPSVEMLAMELEPLLLEFQHQHVVSKDNRAFGFLTTLINFCNELILNGLSLVEKLLIQPYFKFVEEYVALPWQRVCLAAGRHTLDSPAFAIVEHCLPQSEAIAQRTYAQLLKDLPHHHSRRGYLSDPGITHSCIRDMQMNQAYFWLSFLEGNLQSVHKELVPLCIMVLPAIGVSWQLIERLNQVMFDDILSLLTPAQGELVHPFRHNYIEAFKQKRSDFQTMPKSTPTKGDTPARLLENLTQVSANTPSGGASLAKRPAQTANQVSEVERLQAKMAELEAELSNARQQIITLLPKGS